jgi:beta-lactamase class A
MISESDNTATNLVIEMLGIKRIDDALRLRGYRHSRLRRLMMARITPANENLTSAREVVLLLASIAGMRCLGEPFDPAMMAILKKQKNRSMIPAGLPDGIQSAGKTGMLLVSVDGGPVYNDSAVVFTAEGGFVVCVLTSGVDNAVWRIKQISRAVFGHFTKQVSP